MNFPSFFFDKNERWPGQDINLRRLETRHHLSEAKYKLHLEYISPSGGVRGKVFPGRRWGGGGVKTMFSPVSEM